MIEISEQTEMILVSRYIINQKKKKNKIKKNEKRTDYLIIMEGGTQLEIC